MIEGSGCRRKKTVRQKVSRRRAKKTEEGDKYHMEGRKRHSLPDSFTLAVYMQFLVAADSLKEHHTSPHVGTIFTEAPALADQRSQCMTQREVQTLDQTRANRQPQFLQPPGATAHAVHHLLQT